jgi:short-subunit dehydrogenase
VGAVGAGEESSITQAKEVFDINVFGLMRMTNAVLPHLRAQGRGRVVNVSSVLGLIPAPFMAVYAATKHAVEGYSESVDHELRGHGVRMLLVEPAYTARVSRRAAWHPTRPCRSTPRSGRSPETCWPRPYATPTTPRLSRR